MGYVTEQPKSGVAPPPCSLVDSNGHDLFKKNLPNQINKQAISKVGTYYVVLILHRRFLVNLYDTLSLSIQYPDPLTSGFELRRGKRKFLSC